MSMQHGKYELLSEKNNLRHKHTYIQVGLLVILCTMSTLIVYATWTVIYRRNLNIPPKIIDIPDNWIHRANIYSDAFRRQPTSNYNNYSTLSNINFNYNNNNSTIFYSDKLKQIDNEKIYPSKLGNFIYKDNNLPAMKKLVCYYAIPLKINQTHELYLNKIDPNLCTHINIGIVEIVNNQLKIDELLDEYFKQTTQLKQINKKLKILLWVGGGDVESSGFPEMILNHANRKKFIQSLKKTLELYRLDGIDLDYEFPNSPKQRIHFSQLLHEIRREYEREHRTYILSIAVASPQTIIDYSYDIREINNYADYVNIMTYDYHMFTRQTPYTGLNAPLYKRDDEGSIFATLNINYTVNYWLSHGLDKNKIIVGLPTYGHSFKLINAFNTRIGSPSKAIGDVGSMGFVTYSDVCWFKQHNVYVTTVFDFETCSPYLYSGTEWISYENKQSLECKANFIKSNDFGGVMIFSLNTDDFNSYCKLLHEKPSIITNNRGGNDNGGSGNNKENKKYSEFPLVRKIYSILYD